MSPTLVTIDASEPLQAILDIIARDGGVIVSNFLQPDLLNETMSSSKCLTGRFDGMLDQDEILTSHCGIVEPYFRGRSTYKSNATHNELGQDFFPEGSLRVYVSGSCVLEVRSRKAGI